MKNSFRVLSDSYFENIMIVLKSLLVGLLTGVVVVLYRLILTYAEEYTFTFYDYLREHRIFIPLAILILCLAGYFVGFLVSKDPMISGSGIPQIEGILKGYFVKRCKWYQTLLGKFVGGTVAILGGLSLGREGPSIQLGASVAEGLGKKIGKGRLERKILMASGASAGLAAAFGAPMAGVMFALEEIFKYFSPIILLSMMSSAVAADFVSSQVFGLEPIFDFEITSQIALSKYWILILLGIFLGVVGTFYNYMLLKIQEIYGKIKFLNARTRVIIPFLFAIVLGLFFPIVLGSGHEILGELTLENEILFVILIFALKFVFSLVCYGSGAPGGIFFPMIILGAALGTIFGGTSIQFLGFDQELFNNFVILAMAGFFTAIVRAPITGIVLIMEMTGSFTNILPLTLVAVIAYVVADLLKSPPIYEALLENKIHNERTEITRESSRKVVVELIVKHGSKFGNHKVKNIEWPAKALLVGVKQGDKQIIPKGDTIIREGDYLAILTDVYSEHLTTEILNRMNEPSKRNDSNERNE